MYVRQRSDLLKRLVSIQCWSTSIGFCDNHEPTVAGVSNEQRRGHKSIAPRPNLDYALRDAILWTGRPRRRGLNVIEEVYKLVSKSFFLALHEVNIKYGR
jgi:hypothetical protein